jgi:glycine/D-amino acid oxidase-like deaminating enzyme
MRVCIVGGGLAGTLLAWRLSQQPEVRRVHLLTGTETRRDATAVSGGVVRGYEPYRHQRALAIASLAELRDSAVLRRWAAYQETASVYLRTRSRALAAELQEIETAVPGSVQLASDAELSARGWANLPQDTVGILERRAGSVSPASLRTALLGDLAAGPHATVSVGALGAVSVRSDGTVSCTIASGGLACDAVVLAAGAWTPGLLTRHGFETGGLRTKAIRYGVYSVTGERPPPFVDETTGLYGKPAAGGRMILGLATDDWDVPPGAGPMDTVWQRRTVRLARTRLRMLTLRSVLAGVSASDCYCGHPVLALRPVWGCAGALHTFSGGSGGSVKTALAASRLAAEGLVARSPATTPEPCSHAGR